MPSPTWDVELQKADSSWLSLQLDTDTAAAEGSELPIESMLAAAVTSTPITPGLVGRVQEDWSGGVGIDYDGAYGVYTRTPGYACQAGAPTNVPVAVGGMHTADNSPIVAFAEYKGVLYCAQEGFSSVGTYGRVLSIAGSTATEIMAIGITAGCPLLGSAYYIRDLLVADDGSGNSMLWVSASDNAHLNGALYRFDGTTWTSSQVSPGVSGFGPRGMNRLARVSWRTEDNNTAWRMVSITGDRVVGYTLPNSDPRQAASWGPDIKIDTNGRLLEIAAFRRHVFFGASDDVYDLNELGDSMSLTSYLQKMLQTGNGYAIEHINGYLYVAVGRGLIRLYVGDVAALNESPTEGQCAPGWGTPAEGPFRGYVTALTVDQGYLVAAVFNPSISKAFIFWGIDRRIVGKDSPQPMIWYGPEVWIDTGYRATRMWSSGLSGDMRLYVASQAAGAGNAKLDWVPLPIAGSPIQDLASGGGFTFATGLPVANTLLNKSCYLESLQDSGGDKARQRIIYQYDVGTRGVNASGTKLTLEARADPNPAGSTTYTNQGDVTTPPVQTLTPVTPVAGHKLQTKVDFLSSTNSAAVLDSLRLLTWDIAPTVNTVTLPVRWGDDVSGADRGAGRDPYRVRDDLKALTETGRTELRLRGRRWTVKVEQVLGIREMIHRNEPWGRTMHAQVRVSVLGSAP